ncbi:MAG TPA: hypothetical protein VLM87_12440, partial [Rubrivivax sp.]|nr:hypothetical protein [Rubrivivax sp.]
MATTRDRRAVARRAPGRLSFSWLGLVGFVLVLVLLAVALVQARQFALLRQAVQMGDDYVVPLVFQAEIEQLRLHEQWRRAADERVPLDTETLRLRYEIWVSRVELLDGQNTQRLIEGQDDHQQTLQQVRDFIAAADKALGPAPTAALDRDFVTALAPQLEALTAPMH